MSTFRNNVLLLNVLLLEYEVQIYLTVLVDKQFISQGYLQSKT